MCTLDMVKTLPGVRGSRDLVSLLVNLSSIAVLCVCVCVCVLASAGIIGGVVGAGAFFVFIVLVLIIYIVCWRKKRGPFRYVA